MAYDDDPLEVRVATLIRKHTGIGYALREDGLVDPDTLGLYPEGAAHMIVHELRRALGEAPRTLEKEQK